MKSASVARLVCLVPVTLAQFVSPPTDLITTVGNGFNVRYKEVPQGVCETVDGVKSISGYVDVATHQHLFFWFFEARNQDPAEAPLTLWLNGGPGDPSMVGLFSANGPCWIDPAGDVQFNEFSWSNASNMLYLDQPTDVGLSYSNPVNGYFDEAGNLVPVSDSLCPENQTCGTFGNPSNPSETVNSTINAAPFVWNALQGFVGAFPSYARHGFHLAAESYGGHYAPVFADYILEQNAKNTSGTTQLDLRSMSVGNGWFDPQIQYPAYYNFTVSPGNTYSFKPFNQSTEEAMFNILYGPGGCVDQLHACNNGSGSDSMCSTTDNFCYNMVEYVYDTVTGRDEYDMRELAPDPFPYNHFVAYLNKPEVQEAIGAYTNFSYTSTNAGAGIVADAFATTGDDSRSLDIIARNRRLAEKGIYIVHYAGDADYNCNWLGGEEVAHQIAFPGFASAGYQNFTTKSNLSAPQETVHGVVKQSSTYAFVRIYDSGHSVPFYKPLAALTLFERMLQRKDIATGTKKLVGYRSVGPRKSEHQNDPSTIMQVVLDETCTWDPDTSLPVCPGDEECGSDSGLG